MKCKFRNHAFWFCFDTVTKWTVIFKCVFLPLSLEWFMCSRKQFWTLQPVCFYHEGAFLPDLYPFQFVGWDEENAAKPPKSTPQRATVGQDTLCDLEQPTSTVLGNNRAYHETANPQVNIQGGGGKSETGEKSTKCKLQNRTSWLCSDTVKNWNVVFKRGFLQLFLGWLMCSKKQIGTS